jgi:hypothetical protein
MHTLPCEQLAPMDPDTQTPSVHLGSPSSQSVKQLPLPSQSDPGPQEVPSAAFPVRSQAGPNKQPEMVPV